MNYLNNKESELLVELVKLHPTSRGHKITTININKIRGFKNTL
jgi:hypothetical protein